jgi:hypothetical protein
MDLSKIKQTVHVVFNNDEYREYAIQAEIITPNGLTDDEFAGLAKRFGTSFDIIEFEMFWNTGKIPAFCYIRFIVTEDAEA